MEAYMRKIAIMIIGILLIDMGVGYAVPRSHLRPQLMTIKQKRGPYILCSMIASVIGESMRRTMQENIRRNLTALDLGVIYTEFMPHNLLRNQVSATGYLHLIAEIKERSIKMDVDDNGNIWVYHEPSRIYVNVNKEGRIATRGRQQFKAAMIKRRPIIIVNGYSSKSLAPQVVRMPSDWLDENYLKDWSIRWLLRKLASNPRDLISRNNLAGRLIDIGRLDDAVSICKDSFNVISEMRTGRLSLDKGLDREESMSFTILMKAYVASGRFDEAIKAGEEALEKFPQETMIKNTLICAYVQEAEKKMMLGEEYEKYFLTAWQLIRTKSTLFPQDIAIKAELISLGLLSSDKHATDQAAGILRSVRNIYSRQENVLYKGTIEHIVREHGIQGYIRRPDITTTSFPPHVNPETIQELILETARYGVNFSSDIPWWNRATVVWYVADDRPSLANETGVIRMEIRIQNRKIITGFASMGTFIEVHRKNIAIDPSLSKVSPLHSGFVWNLNSKERILVLAGKDYWGVKAVIFNDDVFGKDVKHIWREYIMWQALWRGKFIGYQKVQAPDKKGKIYVEFYRYDIPDEAMERYGCINKTLYFYVDYRSRRLVNVFSNRPRIDYEHKKEVVARAQPEKDRMIKIDISAQPHIQENAGSEDISMQAVMFAGETHYTLGELQRAHKIGQHVPDIEDLQVMGYYYDELTGLFYSNRGSYEKAMEDKGPESTVETITSQGQEPIENLFEPDVGLEEVADIDSGSIQEGPLELPSQKIEKPPIIVEINIRLTREQRISLDGAIRRGAKDFKATLSKDQMETLVNIVGSIYLRDKTKMRETIDTIRGLGNTLGLSHLSNEKLTQLIKVLAKFISNEQRKQRSVDSVDTQTVPTLDTALGRTQNIGI